MKNIIISTLTLVVALSGALFANAQSPDQFANELHDNHPAVFFPERSVGAPDGLYADMLDRDTFIILDLGEEMGIGDLTIHGRFFSLRSEVYIEFLREDLTVIQYAGGAMPSQVWQIAYAGDEAYRYISIRNRNDSDIGIDAVEAEGFFESGEVVEEVIEEEAIVTDPTRGAIVTTVESDIEYLLAGSARHPVLSQSVFDSWSLGDEVITFVGAGTLTGYDLTSPLPLRPGTFMVKTVHNPKVYAIDMDGVLHWIINETVAQKLYGDAWARRIVDVSEIEFARLTQGEDIEDFTIPSGHFVDVDGVVFFIGPDGNRYTVSPAVREALAIKDQFTQTGLGFPEIIENYIDGGDLGYSDDLRWPY